MQRIIHTFDGNVEDVVLYVNVGLWWEGKYILVFALVIATCARVPITKRTPPLRLMHHAYTSDPLHIHIN